MSKPNLPQLTGLRIVAALWVVCFHMALPKGWLHEFVSSAPTWISNLILSGHYGVSLFFVLSGFILAYTYVSEDGQLAKRKFWQNRFARVYPIYFLSLAVMLPLNWNQLQGYGVFKLGFVVVMLQSWLPGFALYWNGPAWSLSAEAFFYIAFPFLLPRLLKVSRPSLGITGCVAVIALMAAVGMVASPDLRETSATDDPIGLTASILNFNPLVRLPEFAMGILFSALFMQGSNRVRPAIPILLLLLLIMGFAHRIPYFAMGSILAPLFGLTILCLADSRKGLLATSVIQKGGEISFAVYLLHVPISQYFQQYVTATSGWIAIVYLAVVLSASWAAFTFLEEPSRKLMRRISGGRT